jgi:hypothetical protein
MDQKRSFRRLLKKSLLVLECIWPRAILASRAAESPRNTEGIRRKRSLEIVWTKPRFSRSYLDGQHRRGISSEVTLVNCKQGHVHAIHQNGNNNFRQYGQEGSNPDERHHHAASLTMTGITSAVAKLLFSSSTSCNPCNGSGSPSTGSAGSLRISRGRRDGGCVISFCCLCTSGPSESERAKPVA